MQITTTYQYNILLSKNIIIISKQIVKLVINIAITISYQVHFKKYYLQIILLFQRKGRMYENNNANKMKLKKKNKL